MGPRPDLPRGADRHPDRPRPRHGRRGAPAALRRAPARRHIRHRGLGTQRRRRAAAARAAQHRGHFVTQQVDGSELGEIHRALGLLPRYPKIDLARLAQEAAQAGFEVLDADEHVGFYRFADVAALIAYLQRVPWDAPDDFSVDEYADELLALHDDTIGAGRPLQATKIRFWLHLRKPEAPLLP